MVNSGRLRCARDNGHGTSSPPLLSISSSQPSRSGTRVNRINIPKKDRHVQDSENDQLCSITVKSVFGYFVVKLFAITSKGQGTSGAKIRISLKGTNTLRYWDSENIHMLSAVAVAARGAAKPVSQVLPRLSRTYHLNLQSLNNKDPSIRNAYRATRNGQAILTERGVKGI